MEANPAILPAFLPLSEHHHPVRLRCQHAAYVCLRQRAAREEKADAETVAFISVCDRLHPCALMLGGKKRGKSDLGCP